jgi:hypothetical protein
VGKGKGGVGHQDNSYIHTAYTYVLKPHSVNKNTFVTQLVTPEAARTLALYLYPWSVEFPRMFSTGSPVVEKTSFETVW